MIIKVYLRPKLAFSRQYWFYHYLQPSTFNMSLAIDPSLQLHPDQVGRLDVFDDPSCAIPYHLTNPVHPLWSYQNWSRTLRLESSPRQTESQPAPGVTVSDSIQPECCLVLPPHTYQRLLPAFRLASLFLEKSLPWFWNVHSAPHDLIRADGPTELRLDESDWTQTKEDQIRQVLDAIAERYSIIHDISGCDMQATGVSTLIPAQPNADAPKDPKKDQNGVDAQEEQNLLTIVGRQVIEFFGSLDWLLLPLAMQHRCLFQFSILMVHELAHVVNLARADRIARSSEPYFRRTEAARELGYSWEHFMFNGIIELVDGELSSNPPSVDERGISALPQWPHNFKSHVLLFKEWHRLGSPLEHLIHPPGCWLVASACIEQYFDSDRWAQWLANPPGQGPGSGSPFQIQLTPARFVTIFNEDLVEYDDWFRDRLRQAADLGLTSEEKFEHNYSGTDGHAARSSASPSTGQNSVADDRGTRVDEDDTNME
jgi:hypothetical protein